jgi:hypothetical protein
MRLIVILLLSLIVACSSPTEQVPCDLFLGAAVVRGVARDFDGVPIARARVELQVTRRPGCDPADVGEVSAATTDGDGRYQVLVQLGNQAGTRCVFGNVEGSDSVSTGEVWFTSSCNDDRATDTLDLDLVVPVESLIPPDLSITIYRIDGDSAGPSYRASVDADGIVTYAGFENVALAGPADTTIERADVARLYRAFQRLNYWSLADEYSGRNCDPYEFNLHYCRTTVVANGLNKQVEHDHGCVGQAALDALTGLECTVDSLLVTTAWTGAWSWPCSNRREP